MLLPIMLGYIILKKLDYTLHQNIREFEKGWAGVCLKPQHISPEGRTRLIVAKNIIIYKHSAYFEFILQYCNCF